MPKPKTRDDLIARLETHPAYKLILERVVIAIAPLFEEIEELEDLLHKSKHLAALQEEDLKKIPQQKIDVAVASRLAHTLANLTSVTHVRELMAQHGGEDTKLKKFKKKELIGFVRDVQYKLSYIKVTSNGTNNSN